MNKKLSLSLLLVIVVVAATPSHYHAQSPVERINVQELIREAYLTGTTMSSRIFRYTWTDTRKYRLLDKKGKEKVFPTQVYEVFPNRVAGRWLLRRLVSENGIPLSPERAAKEQERLVKEMLKDERDAEKEEKRLAAGGKTLAAPGGQCVPQGYTTTYGGNGGLISFSISDFLCAGEFSNPRRGRAQGRDAIVLDFLPRADYRPPGKEREPIMKLRGRIWVDLADRIVSRLEAWPATANDKPSAVQGAPEVVLTYEQRRLPDGTWMHGMTRINTTGHAALFNQVRIDFEEVFTDYRKFDVEAESYQLNRPKL